MVGLVEVAEGVQEHLNHPGLPCDDFNRFAFEKIVYQHAQCKILMAISGTCYTRFGRGR